jgi:uncharacterized protein (DUF169 family)
MKQYDTIASTEAALDDARRAKAQLYRRIEAARCAGAKVLLALEELEGLRHEPGSRSRITNGN